MVVVESPLDRGDQLVSVCLHDSMSLSDRPWRRDPTQFSGVVARTASRLGGVPCVHCAPCNARHASCGSCAGSHVRKRASPSEGLSARTLRSTSIGDVKRVDRNVRCKSGRVDWGQGFEKVGHRDLPVWDENCSEGCEVELGRGSSSARSCRVASATCRPRRVGDGRDESAARPAVGRLGHGARKVSSRVRPAPRRGT